MWFGAVEVFCGDVEMLGELGGLLGWMLVIVGDGLWVLLGGMGGR